MQSTCRQHWSTRALFARPPGVVLVRTCAHTALGTGRAAGRTSSRQAVCVAPAAPPVHRAYLRYLLSPMVVLAKKRAALARLCIVKFMGLCLERYRAVSAPFCACVACVVCLCGLRACVACVPVWPVCLCGLCACVPVCLCGLCACVPCVPCVPGAAVRVHAVLHAPHTLSGGGGGGVSVGNGMVNCHRRCCR